MLYDVLSLWEVAHRWHDVDPNLTDPKALPLPVQDTLRFLTRHMARHELRSCSANGVENPTDEDVVEYEDYVPATVRASGEPEEDEVAAEDGDSAPNPTDAEPELYGDNPWDSDEVYDEYEAYRTRRTRKHNAAIEGFERCFEGRIYDKGKLDSVYMSKWSLRKFCHRQGVALPTFWYTKEEAEEPTPAPKRPSQIDKQMCGAVAQTLWDIDPTLTIAAIIEHKAIQRFANGALYGAKTLRDWVKEVDPRPPEAKRGRPKKSAD